jgi:hypothetical protein
MRGDSSSAFLLGVNYPWLRYGEDFGLCGAHHHGVSLPANQKQLACDFAAMRDCGVSVVRWFLFADGRAGFLSEKGIPTKPDALLLKDIDAALHLADDAGLKLCFALVDYLWLQKKPKTAFHHPHAHVLHSAAGRESFLERVLLPLFQEFRGHAALYAWDIVNEPEWAIREFRPISSVRPNSFAKMRLSDFRPFAHEIAQAVHEFAAVPVTLGSARLSWLRAWSELDLDILQAHYYPSIGIRREPALVRQLHALADLDKPLWLGELPAQFPSSKSYSLEGALTVCRDAGLSGAAVWRWTTPGPEGSDLEIGTVNPNALQSWLIRNNPSGLSV